MGKSDIALHPGLDAEWHQCRCEGLYSYRMAPCERRAGL